ncbi:MAG: hypothetical protein JWN30_1823, partial [Bacilli bacterium]|nr:hypothetical protein [Bacilli bacterium]
MALKILQKIVQFRADFVLFSRWVTCIVLPMIAMSLGSRNALNEFAEVLFVISTLIITLFHRKQWPRYYYQIVVLFDMALASLIVLASGGFYSDMYALYFWTVFEAAFLINWQTGLVTTLLADLCYFFIVLSAAERPSLPTLFTRIAICTIVSIPLLYSSYLEKLSTTQASAQARLLLEKEQLLQELETINRQMTDYTFSVQHLAVVDRLTDLFNQMYFHNRLMVEVEKARIDQYPVSLALFDIDNFKLFNDTHGHHCGDEVLRAVAQTLKTTISGTDFFAGRIGGE